MNRQLKRQIDQVIDLITQTNHEELAMWYWELRLDGASHDVAIQEIKENMR